MDWQGEITEIPIAIVVHGTYQDELFHIRDHPIKGIDKVRYIYGILFSHKNEMLLLKGIRSKRNIVIITVSSKTAYEIYKEIGESYKEKFLAILNGVNKSFFKPLKNNEAKS